MTVSQDDVDARDTLSIHKRPSGGRGEYELMGRDGDVAASQLLHRRFKLVTPWGVKDSNCLVTHQGGKFRFRIDEGRRREGHIAPQLASALLLPMPTREEAIISRALPVILDAQYILDVDLAFVASDGQSVTVRPTVLIARSGDLADDHLKVRIQFDERASQVRALHEAAADLPGNLANLVTQHAKSLGQKQIADDVARAARDIMKALDDFDEVYLPGSDPLGALLLLAGLSDDLVEVPLPPEAAPEVRLRAEHIYRLRKERGPSADKFRTAVQRAYDYRCAFCGLRAPGLKGRMKAGVDAAHILPWGSYDLDVVTNGLVLCKQHHWAFDNRVLRLDHAKGLYSVSLVPDAPAILRTDPPTLALFAGVTGTIPDDRLPAARQRPAPKFIDEFNGLVYATASA